MQAVDDRDTRRQLRLRCRLIPFSALILLGLPACEDVPSIVGAGPDGGTAQATNAATNPNPATAPRLDDNALLGVGAAASAPAQEPCDAEGTLRCGMVTAQREVCEGGLWLAAHACPEGTVCASSKEGEDGSCQAVAEICRGSAGQTVCDGNGTLYACSMTGAVESMTTCASARHCQFGKDRAICAVCVPGSSDAYQCENENLMSCTPEGDGYAVVKTCETSMLCNAVAGDCTHSACSAGQKVCDGDVLKQCAPDLTALEMVKTCELGLCDAEAGDCDVCVPNSGRCEGGNTALVCNGEGTELLTNPCPADRPICVGNGRCVECDTIDGCSERSACKVAQCNIATGLCESTAAALNTRCNDTGYCNANGNCMGCTSSDQCDDQGTCWARACVVGSCMPMPLSTGTCDGPGGAGVCINGGCQQCRAATDCSRQGSAPECQKWGCNNNACEAVPDNRARCTIGLFAVGTCADGRCVECLNAGDCQGNPGTCKEFTCSSSGTCEAENASGGSCTTGGRPGECSSGSCVKLCGNGRTDRRGAMRRGCREQCPRRLQDRLHAQHGLQEMQLQRDLRRRSRLLERCLHEEL